MQPLSSFLSGHWVTPDGPATPIHHAVTGEPVAALASSGLDRSTALDHARHVGGPAMRSLTFPERASLLRDLGKYLLTRTEELYELSTTTGTTRADAWPDIEGGPGVLLTLASKGRRELPDGTILPDGDTEVLARDGSVVGAHVETSRRGVAVHLNAFNFPCWGMLEKLAPTLLAGMPALVKPAPQTAHLAHALFQQVVDSDILPDGAVQLLCAEPGDLLEHLREQDVLTVTGSAETLRTLRSHPALLRNLVPLHGEADSLNAAILAPAAAPDSPEFDLFVREVVREMTTKAGQKCTAIRRILVPADQQPALEEALVAALDDVRVGDPADPGTDMGPLVDLAHRARVREAVARLGEASTMLRDDSPFHEVDPKRGAFLAPTLLRADDARATAVHDVEAFGPVATVIPYTDLDDAVDLAALGRGSLVASVFGPDPGEAARLAVGIAAHHGRILVVDASIGDAHTGHGSPLPHLLHGGPGRAGGGEELGGLRSLRPYLQRTAVQGSPDAVSRILGTWQPGASRTADKGHPFTLTFDDLEVGDAITTASRTVTLEDIEAFADLTGDHFYAHMDEEAAAASPIFGGRVAHGYLVVALAAGLFVWPDPGPVLANYGIDRLRFAKPTYPGDTLTCHLTCRRKTLRAGTGYGEVAWDSEVVNQDGDVVAAYDVLTMVANRSGVNGAE